MIQKMFSHSQPEPPTWAATKNDVPVTRSVIIMVMAMRKAGMA